MCPRCKTTKYRNPSLKLMVNVCGHTLCESCVDLLFLKGERSHTSLSLTMPMTITCLLCSLGSGACPDCNVPLRRSNFRVQMFENPLVEKEVDIRKRILRDYNKKVQYRCHSKSPSINTMYSFKEDDFITLDDYNNYLEVMLLERSYFQKQ